MHSAIIVVKMPADTSSYSGRQKWQIFLSDIVSLENNQALVQLGENVWQADFQQSPFVLAQLVWFSQRHGLSYGILPLADAPQWLPAGFDPKPK